jgi:hypothetical protein
MCLAAIAWPRNAEAAAGAGGDGKFAPIIFYVKVYNGVYVSPTRTANRTAAAGQLVPGQSTVDVKAYGYNYITLSPGGSYMFSKQNGVQDPNRLVSVFYAKNSGAVSELTLEQRKDQKTITLYVLVNASGKEAPTITLAPAGVTF